MQKHEVTITISRPAGAGKTTTTILNAIGQFLRDSGVEVVASDEGAKITTSHPRTIYDGKVVITTKES